MKEERNFGSHSLNFLRECNQNDFPKKGLLYLHYWGSGYQKLVFTSDKAAGEWWEKELERLKNQN